MKYRAALTFEQTIRVRATLDEIENRLRINYQIFDAHSGQRTTTGYTIQVAVEEGSQGLSFVSPPILFERLGVHAMMKSLLAGLLLLSAAAQAVTLDDLQQRFASQPVVRADFNQLREIKGMAQPLKSSGELLIAQDKGLWWHQAKPFPLTLVLDDKRMVQVMNGQAPQIITADSNPQMFQFNHLMRALFQADRQVLEQNFSLDFQRSRPAELAAGADAENLAAG